MDLLLLKVDTVFIATDSVAVSAIKQLLPPITNYSKI